MSYDDEGAWTIRAHGSADEGERYLSETKPHYDELTRGGVPVGTCLPLLGSDSLAYAQLAYRYEPGTLDYLDRALQAWVAAYEYAMDARAKQAAGQSAGDTWQVGWLGSQRVREPEHYKLKATQAWLNAHALATVRGSASATKSLVAVPPELYGEGLQHRRELAAAWRAYRNGDVAQAGTLAERAAVAAAQRSRRKGLIGQWAQLVSAPVIAATAALFSRSADTEQLLAHGFRCHREFYDQKRGLNRGDVPLRDTPEGWLSLPLAALLRLAREQGLSGLLRSDYAAEWIFAAD